MVVRDGLAMFLEQATRTGHLCDSTDSEDIRQQIIEGLTAKYNSPLTSETSEVLQQPLSAEERPPSESLQVRELNFCPSAEHMQLYVTMLQPRGGETKNAEFKVLAHAITCLYLVHQYNWSLLRAFIEAGGMMMLVKLVQHENLHIRGQALQVLLECTSEQHYPWHEPPRSTEGYVLEADRVLWGRMFQLSRSTLIPALVEHFQEPFPGAMALSVRMFAFYASWVRVHFCKERRLLMSRSILSALQHAAKSEQQRGMPVEEQVASKLVADFGSFGPAEDSPGSPCFTTDRAGTKGFGLDDGDDADDVELRDVYNRTIISGGTTSVDRALEWKAQGNEAFRDGRLSEAIDLYSRAIDHPVHMNDMLSESSRRVCYLLNRAQAYLSRATQLPEAHSVDLRGHMQDIDLDEDDRAVELHYQAALLDVNAALELDSGNTKAVFRKARALHGLRRNHEALELAREALATCSKGDARSIQAFINSIRLETFGAKIVELD